jgi:hypothetical protein
MSLSKILSGRLQVGEPGTVTQGPDIGNISSGLYITWPTLNTGTHCWLGNSAALVSTDVSTTDLYVLEDGKMLYFEQGRITNLNEMWFVSGTDSATDGTDFVCWITG